MAMSSHIFQSVLPMKGTLPRAAVPTGLRPALSRLRPPITGELRFSYRSMRAALRAALPPPTLATPPRAPEGEPALEAAVGEAPSAGAAKAEASGNADPDEWLRRWAEEASGNAEPPELLRRWLDFGEIAATPFATPFATTLPARPARKDVERDTCPCKSTHEADLACCRKTAGLAPDSKARLN